MVFYGPTTKIEYFGGFFYFCEKHAPGGQDPAGLQNVSDLNPSSMPLHFTLVFLYGTKAGLILWDSYGSDIGSVYSVIPGGGRNHFVL